MMDSIATEAEASIEPFLTTNDAVEFQVSAHIPTATKA